MIEITFSFFIVKMNIVIINGSFILPYFSRIDKKCFVLSMASFHFLNGGKLGYFINKNYLSYILFISELLRYFMNFYVFI